MFKRSFLIVFTLISSASMYYMYATHVETHHSTYAQFVASYEQLFKEVPVEIWNGTIKTCSNDCVSTACVTHGCTI